MKFHRQQQAIKRTLKIEIDGVNLIEMVNGPL